MVLKHEQNAKKNTVHQLAVCVRSMLVWTQAVSRIQLMLSGVCFVDVVPKTSHLNLNELLSEFLTDGLKTYPSKS